MTWNEIDKRIRKMKYEWFWIQTITSKPITKTQFMVGLGLGEGIRNGNSGSWYSWKKERNQVGTMITGEPFNEWHLCDKRYRYSPIISKSHCHWYDKQKIVKWKEKVDWFRFLSSRKQVVQKNLLQTTAILTIKGKRLHPKFSPTY